MKPRQFKIHIRPENGGAYTRWRLSGSLVTTVPVRQLRWLFRMLSFWSGWPVELVLPAAVATADWFTWWSDVVALVPEPHLHVRFVRAPQTALPKSHER
jgi:hypothetical protein